MVERLVSNDQLARSLVAVLDANLGSQVFGNLLLQPNDVAMRLVFCGLADGFAVCCTSFSASRTDSPSMTILLAATI